MSKRANPTGKVKGRRIIALSLLLFLSLLIMIALLPEPLPDHPIAFWFAIGYALLILPVAGHLHVKAKRLRGDETRKGGHC
jgi:4-hydroxybenzoate polyprenyltransferase